MSTKWDWLHLIFTFWWKWNKILKTYQMNITDPFSFMYPLCKMTEQLVVVGLAAHIPIISFIGWQSAYRLEGKFTSFPQQHFQDSGENTLLPWTQGRFQSKLSQGGWSDWDSENRSAPFSPLFWKHQSTSPVHIFMAQCKGVTQGHPQHGQILQGSFNNLQLGSFLTKSVSTTRNMTDFPPCLETLLLPRGVC